MPIATLDEVQRLADELSPLDQVRLLHHLLPLIEQAVVLALTTKAPPATASSGSWEEFFRLGDELVRQDAQGTETLTAALLSMRR